MPWLPEANPFIADDQGKRLMCHIGCGTLWDLRREREFLSGLNISNFIWGIADDVLRDVYVRGKYRDVILPMTVIRRLDAILEPKKEAVLARKAFLDANGIRDQDRPLKQVAGEAFYNISPFTLRDLTAKTRQQQLKADFTAYLDGFAPNVQDILTKFKFRNQIDTLAEANALGPLIDKFLHPSVNLSPYPLKDEDGRVRVPGLDNHSMGTIFEELIRRFNEDNNEEAGEHFTPRDVIELMANLIFLPVAERIDSGTYLIYDAACGTGGMLTVAEEALTKLAADHDKEISTHLFGQEVNAETYAISKADLLLKGEGAEAERIQHGSTLSADAFPSLEFDFMLSNPPYGKSWKTDLERMGGKKDLKDPRFVIQHGGDAEFSLITRSSDGQLMFLANKLAKMKRNTPLGSRIAEVHNGSSLFTGDAGSGESNIRRWVIENDWLEAIVALPEGIFYNTGIATYVWVLSNRKAHERRGLVQLMTQRPARARCAATSARRIARWGRTTSTRSPTYFSARPIFRSPQRQARLGACARRCYRTHPLAIGRLLWSVRSGWPHGLMMPRCIVCGALRWQQKTRCLPTSSTESHRRSVLARTWTSTPCWRRSAPRPRRRVSL